MSAAAVDELVLDEEHFAWCNPGQCHVVRPDRRRPNRRTVRHRKFVRHGSIVIETFLVTHQDSGAAKEVDEFGVTGLVIGKDAPAHLPELGFDEWCGLVAAAMTAAENRRLAVLR